MRLWGWWRKGSNAWHSGDFLTEIFNYDSSSATDEVTMLRTHKGMSGRGPD